MRAILIRMSLLSFFFSSSCIAQEEVFKELHFNAQNRGHSETITVVNYTVFYKTQQNSKTYFINKEKRKKLEELVTKTDLDKISSLKAPSSKRLFDGAMTANISIKKGKKTYISSSFDDDNPPKELKEIIVLLRSFKN